MENGIGNGRVLPSAFQPGQDIGLQGLINELQNAGNGKVLSVTFLKDKYKYNIVIPIIREWNAVGYFRLANIDSALVHAPFDNGFHYNDKVSIQSRAQQEEHRTRNEFKDYVDLAVKMQPEPKVLDASSNGFFQKPFKYSNKECSDTVLIDIDGNRKWFVLGWYDFEYNKWSHSSDTNDEITIHMRWTYLPLAKYDKK